MEIAENSTPTRSVRFDKHRGKWLAQIKIKGKAFNPGRYQKQEEAYRTR
ncbi:MAG: AP2 domain-containing protein [Methyloceanibacter sp.]